MKTVTLWRPVGQAELDLIESSGWRTFPPRLPGQPIFYPVCTEEYATQIAMDWNAKQDGVGYVTSFKVRAKELKGREIHVVGSRLHTEYWIPAEELDRFNAAIVGNIELAHKYVRGDDGTVACTLCW